MNYLKKIITLIIIAINTQLIIANISTADIFSDNMVLQRNLNLKIWGKADPGEKLTLRFNGQKVKTIADNMGKWSVKLEPMQAGGPFNMTIKGKNEVVLHNILIGDVWICSGQSNMQWTVAQSNNAEREIETADYPQIRLFNVPKKISNVPVEEMPNASWQVCNPETVKNFSAVGYFFGRELQKKIDVPIGLINSTWGGTCVETWTSKESITKLPYYENMDDRIDNFDIEEVENRNRKALRDRLGSLPEKETGIKEKWMMPESDRSDWKSINLPTYWEDAGYNLLDGILWFCYEFNLDAEESTKKAFLNLGKIDNSDITWINGQKVGEMQWGSDVERFYNIPENVLNPGKNFIIIRVDDKWGKGGFASKADRFFLQLGKVNIPISGEWKFKADKVYDKFKPSPNEVPSLLYNGMINPLIPYGIKGVIWYQGENNTPRAKEYAITFPNMINNWRENWQQSDFPFLFVQLANFMEPKTLPGNDNWAELRESQTKTLDVKNTGMAVAIDIGEASSIHPKNKQEVGRRLMLSALKVAYGEDIVHSGPIYKSIQIEGGKAIISYDYIGSGLMVKNKHGYISEFEIAGDDKQFYWAKAELVGDKVVVWSDKVKKPVAVRFGWASNPEDLNLYNKDGLPASPFRTDDWKGITDGHSFDD